MSQDSQKLREEQAAGGIYRFVVRMRQADDPRALGLLADAHALGLAAITWLECQDLYFLEIDGPVPQDELRQIGDEILSDPVTQTAEWGRLILQPPAGRLTIGQESGEPQANDPWVVEVSLRPGVTNPVAEQILRAARVLNLGNVRRATTGQRYLVRGDGLDAAHLHQLCRRLLANAVIQNYTIGAIEPVFPQPATASGQVETLAIRGCSDKDLLALSQERRAALDLAEMQAIQTYARQEGRDLTDIELETIAQTWSEHCVHKTFRAVVEVSRQAGGAPAGQGETIDGLLRTYIRAASEKIAAPWVRSAFVDNAGIIDFDEEYEVSFKVETHNHPSAIEPFGGANTGTGGVIRDVLGVSARPIAATDVLCFGPQDSDPNSLPEGVLHPRRIQSGVVAGIQDYGNKMGIPTVSGAILYDPGYTANPLVFCGCVGIAPKGRHPRDPQAGDRVIVIGGRTGRDGLRGATFSSMTMDGQTGEVSGASVQIGDPITEKGVLEVLVRARDLGLYHAVTDCGAGGLSSAVGEMSSQTGAEVELEHVRLKYPGLAPWEIWLSEAQERMVLAVPPEALPALINLCELFEVELTDLGSITGSGRLVVRYQGRVVLDLDNHFLHEGLPRKRMQAFIPTHDLQAASPGTNGAPDGAPVGAPFAGPVDYNLTLLRLLAHPDIASKAGVIRVYDHEVQGATVVKPLTGARDDGPADACVLKPLLTRGLHGLVLSNGINPQYGKVDPYRMAASVVDEAIRNAVAAGADPQRIALLDNFCWGDPKRPEMLGALAEAARGCYDAAVHYETPFISGKDSLNNEYLGADGQRHAIPPTLLISAIGLIEEVTRAVTLDLKSPGGWIYLLGEPSGSWGGSHFGLVTGEGELFGEVPPLPDHGPKLYSLLHAAMRGGLVDACHDLSEGGLAVAAAEMCIAGRLGMALSLYDRLPLAALFGETNGCLLVEVDPASAPKLEKLLAGLPFRMVGQATADGTLSIAVNGEVLISLPVERLAAVWKREAPPEIPVETLEK